MSVAAAVRESQKKSGDLQAYLIGAVKIYKGTLVSARVADGFAYGSRSGTSTDSFLGVAHETIDNSAGAAGAALIQVEKGGSHVFVAGFAAAQTDVGAAVYANDDSTVYKTTSNNQLVGYITEVISSSLVRVRINRGVQ